MNISVVIPTYNRSTLVRRAIESILAQEYAYDVEIIVVDDGSTDNTKDILQKYDITYISQPNQGISSARNSGIRCAKYDWIMLLDSDDVFEPNKLYLQAKFHQVNLDIKFSHTNQKWIRDNKTIKKPKNFLYPEGSCFKDNLTQCYISASSVMVHKSIFENIGYFNEALPVCEDYDMWLRISLVHEVGYIHDMLITKYAGHTQLSSDIRHIDVIHVGILEQFVDTKYQKQVLNILISKYQIILKGANKHNNDKYIDKYTKALQKAQKWLLNIA